MRKSLIESNEHTVSSRIQSDKIIEYPKSPFYQHPNFIGLSLSFAVLFIYLYNLCPTVYFWDSAELTSASYALGLPHSPGFPLYILWGRLISLLPFATPAYRMNFFSAVCGAVTVFFLFQITRNIVSIYNRNARIQLTNWEYFAAAFLLLFAVSFSALSQSVRAEVYFPNLLIISLILYCAVKSNLHKSNSIRWIIVSSYLAGLGTGIHHLTALLIIPGLLFFIPVRRILKSPASIAACVMAFFVGVSNILYIPIRYLAGAEYFWGDGSSIGGVLAILTSSDFGVPTNTFTLNHLSQLIGFDFSLLWQQLGFLGLLGVIVGIRVLSKRIPGITIGICLILLCNLLSIIFFEEYFYSYLDLHGYLLPSIAILFVLAGVGFTKIFNKLISGQVFKSIRQKSAVLVSGLLIILAMGLKTTDSLSFSLRNYIVAEEMANRLCQHLDEKSIVVCSSVNSKFLIDYKKVTDERYKDLGVVDLGLLQREWYRDRMTNRFFENSHNEVSSRELLREIIARNGSNLFMEFSPALLSFSSNLKPDGILYKYSSRETETADQASLDVFPWIEGDPESSRLYAEWLLNRWVFFYSRGEGALADSALSALTNIDRHSSDIIEEYRAILDTSRDY
ncbi:MAG: DUF2723 domain-containing protein [candidate division Zixibacteria bacterium]|nr:DUF2723 domain-containing protein [candidate division Zixibacteria bacterium]